MEVLIESTKSFEKDLDKLNNEGKSITVKKINDCADLFFGQVIFTLLRVVKHDDLDKAYQGIAESLYQQILHNPTYTRRSC